MNYIFDFDGTLISKLLIDYIEMKNKLKYILNYDGELSPMIDKIYELSDNSNVIQKCFDLIDNYELMALDNYKINKDILDLYNESTLKIILSRNGRKVINKFFYKNNLIIPDFISCRDNCINFKPNIEQLEVIIDKYPQLNNNNIIIVGDSWHDKMLAKNYGCKYFEVL